VPSESFSTYSTWSRSRELSLSMDDHSSARKSRAWSSSFSLSADPGAAPPLSRCLKACTSRITAVGKSGWNPASTMTCRARALRSKLISGFHRFGMAPALGSNQEHQPHAGADGAVGHVESREPNFRPAPLLEVKVEEINHVPHPQPINEVAQNPAHDQPESH